MPTISLVTITYNSAQTIQATLDSIHSQCCDDFEYIIIDAQSTDETLALIDAHPVQVDCLISEPDDGLYDALNKVLQTHRTLRLVYCIPMMSLPASIHSG